MKTDSTALANLADGGKPSIAEHTHGDAKTSRRHEEKQRGYDDPTLRSVRESQNVTLRKVAREANMSHGHLSKVERGEPGRPVTPKVLHAYEKATGIKLTGTAGHRDTEDEQPNWRRGYLSEARRRMLNAKIAAVSISGILSESVDRALDGTGRPYVPSAVADADLAALEQVTATFTAVDLRYGGEVAAQPAKAQLRWAIMLLDTGVGAAVKPRLYAAVAALAQRAGWAAFDADDHEAARTLYCIGLYATARADDPDLRAHIVADLAAQYNFLGYPGDCLEVARFGCADERVRPAVRVVLAAVKARAYALLGNQGACWQQIELAEQYQAAVAPAAGWLDTIATPAQLHAGSGHALATLARRTADVDARKLAVERLGLAIDELDPASQTRARVLCLAQLTALHFEAGVLDEGVRWGRRLLDAAAGIRSARLADYLNQVRIAARDHEHETTVNELLEELEDAL